MALLEWRGDAASASQIAQVVVTNVVPGANYKIQIDNTIAEYRAKDTDTVQSIAQQLAATLTGPNWTVTQPLNGVITLTGTVAGVPFGDFVYIESTPASYVQRVQAGVVPVAQQLRITVPSGTTGGTFTVTCTIGGVSGTTSAIAYNATAATVRAALEALTIVGAGNVDVTQISATPVAYQAEFKGARAGQTVAIAINAAALTGHAKVNIKREQTDGSDAPKITVVNIRTNLNFSRATPISVTISGVTQESTLNEILTETYWSARLGSTLDKFHVTESMYYDSFEARSYITFNIVISHRSNYVIGNSGGSSFNGFETMEYLITSLILQNLLTTPRNAFQVLPLHRAGQTYTFSGQTTAPIPGGTSYTGLMQTAFEGLSTIGAGNVTVHAIGGYKSQPFIIVEFKGALSGAPQPLMTATREIRYEEYETVPAVEIQIGAPKQPTIDSIAIIANGGTWSLTYNGNTSSSIAAAINRADLQTRLATITALTHQADPTTGFNLSGAGTQSNPFLVTFGVSVATVYTFTANASGLTGGANMLAVTTRPAVAGKNEIQRFSIDPTAIAGTFQITLGSVQTSVIAFNADASGWTIALVDAFGSGTILATGTAQSMTVEFRNQWGNQPLGLATINQTALIVQVSSLVYEIVQLATGPTWWNAAGNWTAGRAPSTGDDAVLGSGRAEILYGLRQRGRCTFGILGVDTVSTDFVAGQLVRFQTSGSFPAFRPNSFTATRVGSGGSALAGQPAASTYYSPTDYDVGNSLSGAVWSAMDLINSFGPITSILQVTASFASSFTSPTLGTAIITIDPFARTGNILLRHLRAGITLDSTIPLVFNGPGTQITAPTPGLHWSISGVQINLASTALPTPALGPSVDFEILSAQPFGNGQRLNVAHPGSTTPLRFVDNGTGNHTVAIRLASLQTRSRFSGSVGWPRRNNTGEWNDRQRYLRIDLLDPVGANPNLEIGTGDGGDSVRRFMFDAGESTLSGRVIRSQSAADAPAIQILNQHASSELFVINGDVGIAIEPDELATLQRIVCYAGRITLGNVNSQRIEDYMGTIRRIYGTASGSTIQTRTR